LEDLPKNIRICINRKYQKLTNKYCINKLISQGYKIEKVYVSGASEEMFSKSLVDLVVDIVYSGKSAKEVSLQVYEKIFCSDIVVIGGKNEIFK
jgi:ATP phosphoribosyltransferase